MFAKCSYVPNQTTRFYCGAPSTHIVTFSGRNHELCAEHAKPEYHPSDLHDRIRPRVTVDRSSAGEEDA